MRSLTTTLPTPLEADSWKKIQTVSAVKTTSG
jgi:hypothetical protein